MSALSHAKHFWNVFEKKESLIQKSLQENDYETLNGIVEELDDLSMEISGCHFFVENIYDDFEITFDTGPNKTSQYLATLLKQVAPSSIQKKWVIHDALPPLSSKAVQAQIQIKDMIYNLNDFHVFYRVQEENQTLSCQVYCPGFNLIKNPENKKEMSMYLLELALGECAYEAYISFVDFLDVPSEEVSTFCNLIDFYEVVMSLVDTYHWKEYAKPQDIYSIYQPIQDIVHDSLRKDMKYIFTTHPMLIEETIENQTDVLWDLKSKEGEFGYIYYANPFQNKEDALFRQNLSKVLDEAISKTHAGKVIGGAIGKSYSYIDWIVYDHDLFIQTLQSIKKQFDTNIELHYQSFEQDHVTN